MADVIVIAVLVMIIGSAARYVYKAKKRGAKCIGCPAGGCACHCHANPSGCACSGGASAGHTEK